MPKRPWRTLAKPRMTILVRTRIKDAVAAHSFQQPALSPFPRVAVGQTIGLVMAWKTTKMNLVRMRIKDAVAAHSFQQPALSPFPRVAVGQTIGQVMAWKTTRWRRIWSRVPCRPRMGSFAFDHLVSCHRVPPKYG